MEPVINDLFSAFTTLSKQCANCPKAGTCHHKKFESESYIFIPARACGKIEYQNTFIEILKRRTNYENHRT